MGRIWVLDTETKGTGASMVPLDKLHARPQAAPEAPIRVPRKPRPRPPAPPEPRVARRFRVTDVLSREVLADDVGVRDAVRALEPLRSVVDVNVHVWQPKARRWRLLTHSELRLLWDRRGQLGSG